MSVTPDQSLLLEQLRKFVLRAQTSADGRPMVIYFLRQPERIGQITHELFMLKGVYSPVDHQVFVAHPRAQPRSRHFSQDAYNIAMRDLIPLEARDELEDRVCYANIRDPVPMANNPPLTLILGSEPSIARVWFDKYGTRRDGYPIHWLTEVEKQRGRRLEERLGIGKDTPVVVLHVREQGLLGLAYETHRNADIANYERAIRLLLDRGYAVVRIGDPYCKKLPFHADGLIDTPFLDSYDRIGDPYFVSRCAFMIHSYSGPAMLATAFNRPTLAVNIMPQDMTTMTDEVVVYKEYRRQGGGPALSLAEIDRAGLMNAIAEHFAAAGCESAENDPDLLHDAVLEMLDRQAGRFTPSPALIAANARLDAFGRARHETFRQDPTHFMGYSLLGLHGRQSLSEAFLARYPGFLDQIAADGSVASSPQ